MSGIKNEVLVVLEEGVENKKEFEGFILKEGFNAIENEPFAYTGVSTTPYFNTTAYIFEIFSKAFEKVGVNECKLICQIGSHPPTAYLYKKDEFFTELES
ncbi:MAG: hypothetical protein LBQ18_00825 [Campylobacteraceae bacterium]|nr:hypothetical protein [Campylobacteraceae bacterium]